MNILKYKKWTTLGILLCSASCTYASMDTSPAVSSKTITNTPASVPAPHNPFDGGNTVSPAYIPPAYIPPAPLAPALRLQENMLLSQAIKQWAEGNHYKLFWNSKKDYLVYSTITLTGKTDDEILQSLGELFFSENYGLVVKKYAKNQVIVVDEM